MTRLESNLATAMLAPVDAVLWRTYDDGGWKLLGARRFGEANQYFQKAMERAEQFPPDDFRRGRTLAGIAWTEYRLAEFIQETGEAPADPDTLFRSAYNKAAQAVRLLSAPDIDQRERQYLARAQHVLGLTQIELCEGTAAEQSLAAAGGIYRDLRMTEDYFDVLHLRAKLRQCRREFSEAAALFRQILNEAADPERKFGALVDLANTLSWTGFIREAWQLRVEWQRLEALLEARQEEKRPLDELFRGRLVFARVHLLYGDFDKAEEILRSAHTRLCGCPTISAICRTVYWLVAAELALQRGDLPRVDACLSEFHLIWQDIKLSERGYGCLEIVAIDAACQVCIVETCTYEVIRRRCCFRRRCCRVVFTSTTKERKPIDFHQILAAIVNGMRAGVEYHKARLAATQVLLRDSIAAIETHLDMHSPLLIPPRLLQAEVAQSRKASPVDVRKLLKIAGDIVAATKSSIHPFSAERDRLLANWRVTLSEYDLAAALYRESLNHSANFRSELHPAHVFAQIALAAAEGANAAGERDGRADLQRAQEAMWPKLEVLQRALNCRDYRIGLAMAEPVWLCLLSDCLSSAQRGFDRLTNYWVERDVALTLVPPDYRRADVLLGTILTHVQEGVPPHEMEPLFLNYRDLATCEITHAMAALELNRVGMLVMRAFLLDAAKYCFDKAIEIYPSQNYGKYRPTAYDNLKELSIWTAELEAAKEEYRLPKVPEELPAYSASGLLEELPAPNQVP